MTPKEFMAEFGTLADAPGGIKKLRELVLGFAVSGRLSDGAAQSGWVRRVLREVGSWAVGNGFPKNFQGEKDKPYPFCKVSDMNLPGNELWIERAENSIDDSMAKAMHARLHPRGTVVFPKIGGAIATNKRRILRKPTAIDNNCLGITPHADCDSFYLHLLLRSLDFTQYQAGTSVPALSQGVLGEVELLLPPLPEQKRIVAKVDQLMALLDDLEAKQGKRQKTVVRATTACLDALTTADSPDEVADAWKRVTGNWRVLFDRPEAVGELRKAVLELAVRGRLTSTCPSDEPARSLLNRLAPSFAQRDTVDRVIENGDSAVLPSGWQMVRLGGVVRLKSGTTLDPALERPAGAIPYVKVGDMNLPANAREIVTSTRFVELSAKIEPMLIPAGSIIFPKRGGAIATNKKRIVKSPILVDLNTMAMICPQEIDFDYLYYWFLHIDLWTLNNGTSVPQINNKDLEPLQFPVPPRQEQERIARRVGMLLALCDDLEAKLRRRNDRAGRLVEAVVGEMVAG